MNIFFLAIAFSLIGGVGSLWGGIMLLNRLEVMKKVVIHFVSLAAGALIGAAFLDLIPEAIEVNPENIQFTFIMMLVGFSLFFVLEGFFLWFHHHDGYPESDAHEHGSEQGSQAAILLTIGDSIHNFVDGVAIGAAFLIDIPTGIVTALAVAAHEVPHEMGDFVIMLNAGWSKSKVIISNVLSALVSVVGTILVLTFQGWIEPVAGYLLAVTAGFFLYIGAADLIPEIYRSSKRDKLAHVVGLFFVGVAVIALFVRFLE